MPNPALAGTLQPCAGRDVEHGPAERKASPSAPSITGLKQANARSHQATVDCPSRIPMIGSALNLLPRHRMQPCERESLESRSGSARRLGVDSLQFWV